MAARLLALLNCYVTPSYVGLGIALALLSAALVQLCNDSLRHIPGPLIARFSPAWLWVATWRGVECRTVAALHRRYGSVVRVAPNEVDIADGAAVPPIYVSKGGFRKHPVYRNYDVLGFATIFSAVEPAERSVQAKAVAPLFAQQAIVKGRGPMEEIIGAMIRELQRRKAAAAGGPLDVLNLFRALSIDLATVYLFGESFAGLGPGRLRSTAFVDDFASGGRFFYIPGWLHAYIAPWAGWWHRDRAAIAASTEAVKTYATHVVDKSLAEEKGEGQTYQGRLLGAGISREETIAQVVDILFAGTDATGTTLSTLCWYFAKHPEKYERARGEVEANPGVDPQTLPYLSGAVKESLRLSMANPTRLPRIVPAEGLRVPGGPPIPAGVSVGCAAHMLQLDAATFPDPHAFRPERWLDPTPAMLRNSFAFGAGPRQCIARNLAAAELSWTAQALLRSDTLKGARPVKQEIELREWFNAQVVGGKVELCWN